MATQWFRRRKQKSIVALAVATLLVAGGLAFAVTPTAQAATTPTWTTVQTYDFNGAAGSQPSTTDWLYDSGHSYPYPGAAWDWGTGEIETVTNAPQNVAFDGQGNLLITEKADASGNYTSARIETQRTDFAAPAGGQLKVTARLQQPSAANALGLWPAFWMLGADARPVGATNWPHIGELDIMEDIDGLSEVSHTFHCGAWAQPPCHEPDGITSDLLPCPGCQTAFHTYSVIIDRSLADEQVRFYTDDVLQHTITESQVVASSPDGEGTWDAAVHHGFFLILNLAIDGSYVDKVCGCPSVNVGRPTSGATMAVDWVSVQTSGGGGSPTSSSVTPTTPTSATTTTTSSAPPTTGTAKPTTTAGPTTTSAPTATTTAATIAGTPSNLRASATSNSATLTWSGPANASYDILRGEGGVKIASVVGNSFTDSGLNANTPYVYSVRGTGGTTPQVTVIPGSTTTTSAPPPTSAPVTTSSSVTTTSSAPPTATTAPSNLKSTATSNSVTLSWSGPANASYDILRGEGGVKIASVVGNTFTDSNLGANTPYVYSVRNTVGTSPQITVKTLP